MAPIDIIKNFVQKWNIKVIFEKIRACLEVETQRQWSEKIIARTTPLLMGLFSFVTLVAFTMHQTKALVSIKLASWYNNQGASPFQILWLLLVVRSDQTFIFPI